MDYNMKKIDIVRTLLIVDQEYYAYLKKLASFKEQVVFVRFLNYTQVVFVTNSSRKLEVFPVDNATAWKCLHCYRKKLFIDMTLRPMQTDATLLANNKQHCWAQHVASVCIEPQQCWHLLALVAYSLKPVKLLGPCKRTQHCWP